MSSEAPTFSRDLMGSMALKGQFPERSLFVSLELSLANHNDFWMDPEVLSILPPNCMIVRLVKGEDDLSISQFQGVFHVAFCPSLAYFGPNSPALAKLWDEYPSPSVFVGYFRPSSTVRHERERAPEPAPRRVRTTTKIRVRGRNGASIDREFQVTDTIADVRSWIALELGSDVQVVVGHTREHLPEDDTMTLAQADLCPTAELRVVDGDVWEPEVNIEPPTTTSGQTQTRRRCKCSCPSTRCRGGRAAKFFRLALSFVNPWYEADEEDDDGWEFRPNPELAQQMREQARMMNRMHYRPQV